MSNLDTPWFGDFQAAATEELRDAGQRKIAGFAERAAVSERQARDAVARLRSLEASQAVLQVRYLCFHRLPWTPSWLR